MAARVAPSAPIGAAMSRAFAAAALNGTPPDSPQPPPLGAVLCAGVVGAVLCAGCVGAALCAGVVGAALCGGVVGIAMDMDPGGVAVAAAAMAAGAGWATVGAVGCGVMAGVAVGVACNQFLGATPTQSQVFRLVGLLTANFVFTTRQ